MSWCASFAFLCSFKAIFHAFFFLHFDFILQEAELKELTASTELFKTQVEEHHTAEKVRKRERERHRFRFRNIESELQSVLRIKILY